MPETGKVRMSIWVEPEDRERLRYIAERVGLGTESGAIRFAVRRVERMMRAEEAKERRADNPCACCGESQACQDARGDE